MNSQSQQQPVKPTLNTLPSKIVSTTPIPADKMSIIITTSPIKSHPCTQLIDDSITSINEQPSLSQCHIWIVCDGVKIYHENKYKSGAITQEFLARYNQYKEKIKQKYGKYPHRYTIIQRQYHYGFAGNIKYIMEEYAKTQFILMYQHDHIIDGPINFYQVFQAMQKHPKQINYVTFMNKTYTTLIPRICSHLPSRDYLLSVVGQTKHTFNAIRNMEQFQQKLIRHYRDKFGVGFLPMNFWYDKVHIARRDYYLSVIFRKQGNFDPHLGKNQKTVSFVEDTFGHCMKWSIEQNPKKFEQYGAYLVWNKQSVFYHNNGRSFLTNLEKDEVQKVRVEINKTRFLEKGESSSDSEQNDQQFLDLQTMVAGKK